MNSSCLLKTLGLCFLMQKYYLWTKRLLQELVEMQFFLPILVVFLYLCKLIVGMCVLTIIYISK